MSSLLKLSIITSLSLLITIDTIKAQALNGSINGLITDINGQSLVGASILLTQPTDSLVHRIVVAGKNGKFLLAHLPMGNYAITISHIGYQTYKSAGWIIDSSHLQTNLPRIILVPVSNALKTVTVSSKKPLLEQRIDRTIVNVDALLTVAGSNAMDVLARSPGVSVNANDDIRLFGKNNLLVLIDDRPTYLSAQSLAAYLRSLPAGLLDKVELISNPPARYDANGNAVINIVLKKNNAPGFNGSLALGYNQGVYARNNESVMSNYRVGKCNVFGNSSYNLDNNFNDQSFERYFYDNTGSLQKQIINNSFFRTHTDGWNARIGMDYFASKATTVGILLTGNFTTRKEYQTYHTRSFNNQLMLDSMADGKINGEYGANNVGMNINAQHTINEKGQQLSLSADGLQYKNTGTQNAPLQYYKADGSLLATQQREFYLPSTVQIKAVKLDYHLPFGATMQTDAGFKSSFISTENAYEWLDDASGSLQRDDTRSNHFRYTEQLNAGYVNGKKEWKRWAVQAGLRVENTNVSGRQFANSSTKDSAFYKHYNNFFPSLYVLYKLDSAGNHTVVLNYGRRITRPSYQQLNPFLFYKDNYSYSGGNAALQASLGNYVEGRYSYKSFFGITLGYGGNNNGINALTTSTGDVFITRPVNFLSTRQWVLVAYFNYPLLKCWTINFHTILLWQHVSGQADGIRIEQHNGMHEFEITNQFQMGRGWSAELAGFFPGKQTFAQTKSLTGVYNISAGIQKKILHGNGNIRFNVNNIFNSLIGRNATTGIDNVVAYSVRNSDNRRIGIAFNYNFGKAANARKRSDASSVEDEKTRAK